MTTVPVTGEVRTATGRRDSRDWAAYSPVYREGTAGEVITTRGKEFPVRVVAGQFTAQLEPGVIVIENPDGKQYTVTVPDEPADLWELIATAEAFPPDTAQDALAAAVTTWLDENPVVTMQVEGITDAGDIGQLLLLADTTEDVTTAAGASESGAAVFSGTPLEGLDALGGVRKGELVFNVADYAAIGVISGTRAQLQAAITECKAAGGGTVFVPDAEFDISGGKLTIDNMSGITIQGAGRGSVIKTTTNHRVIEAINVSGLTIRDIQVQGNNLAKPNLQIGLWLEGVTNSLVHNVYVKNLGYDGICLITGCVGVTVSDCRADGCGDDGINVGGSGPDSACQHNVVTGNVSSGCGGSGIHISDGSSYTTCVGNTVYACLNGIDTFQSGAAVGMGGNTITGNTIRGCTEVGIYIRDSNDNIIASNRIDGGQFGMRSNRTARNTFADNVVSGSSSYGFRDETTSSDTTVVNSMFYGATCGVAISGPRSRMQGNTLRGITGTAVLQSGADSVIAGNIISGGSGIGISIVATAGCVVANNRLDGGTTQITASSGAVGTSITGNSLSGGTTGVSVAAIDCVVAGNVIKGQTTYGVSISATGTDCLVSGNQITSQGTYGVFVNGPTRPHVVHNHFRAAARSIQVTNSTDAYVANNSDAETTNGSLTEGGSTNTIVANNRFTGNVFLGSATSVLREIGADYLNYGNQFGSGTNNWHRGAWKQASATLSNVSGATVTAANLIPPGALLLGVTSRINIALGTGNGTTGYTVGDGTDPDLWGGVALVASGSATQPGGGLSMTGYTAQGAAGVMYLAAQSVVITATGGNFNGTGEIEVVAHYMIVEAT